MTPYADLDELIDELVGHWRRILADGLAGAWIQGSFALGAGDLYSDCDWIVATHAPLTEELVAALRRIHDEIPTREGHWPHDIEGSYAPFDELASVEHLGRRWLFNDHGHRTLKWSDHCNRGYTRWILREHGITLTGPAPRTFMPPVPPELLRRETATAIPTLMTDLATWLDIDALAWVSVTPWSPLAAPPHTGDRRGGQQAGALEWAMRTFDSTWRPLLGQVGRPALGFDIDARPRPGSAQTARELWRTP